MKPILLGIRGNEGLPLEWNTNNGMIIAGVSGSGKSHTASLYLTHYAYNGAKIILGDYGASVNTGESLTERVSHLERAMYLPPVSSGKDIIRYIEQINELGKLRQDGKADMFPLIFAIDEFSAFVMNNKPEKKTRRTRVGDKNDYTTTEQKAPNYLETLIDSIITLRKFNIKFMLIGQEWAQMGTNGVRSLRSNIRVSVIHELDDALARLFGFTDTDSKRQIMNLGTGNIFFKGDVYQVPLLSDRFIAMTVDKLAAEPRITAPAVYTRETIKLEPELTFKTVNKCRKGCSKTCCLANLLGIKCGDLKERRKYG